VVTVHDVMWLKTPQLVEKNSFLRVLSKSLFATGALRALKDASIIITVSNATRDDVLDIEPDLESRIRVIHNAPSAWCRPSDNLSQSHARAHALLGSSAPFFLVVGVNQPYKNHAATLRAFAQLPKTDAILVLVQRRASGRELIKLAQMLGIEKRVIFTKTQHRDDLLALLQAATALLHPSKAEGFGLPLLEAAACGCPVIATDIAPLREVLGEAGILVSHGPRLISELCAAMNQLLTNPSLREELRAKGLERAKGFSFGRSASRTLEAYRDAAALGPRRMQ
jgi:glycosyltransferase involved in cell wall biosynthesis